MAEASPWVHPPKLPDGTYDRPAVRELYMASQHVEWTAFARAQGWHAQVTRSSFPIKAWKKAKKRQLAKQHAEEFEDLSFDQVQLWKKETLRTLREYPRSIETIKTLVDQETNRIIREANAAARAGQAHTLPLDRLEKLTNMMSTLTAAKHKSLLLNEVSLKIAQEPLTPVEQQKQDGGVVGFRMKIIGKGEMGLQEIKKSVAEWYDAPMQDVTPPAALAGASAIEDEEDHG